MATRALTPLGLFALALVVRLLPWPTVLESGRVVFFGMDAWYHARRIRLALANGGWPPSFDPYLNFPHGAQPIWSPLFDAMAAWMLWPIHALTGTDGLERAAALLPPVLGAACVVVTWRLARSLFDGAVALVAGLLLSVLSAHYWYSQIGFLDHHVAVALAATLVLLVTTRTLGATSLLPFAATGALAGVCLLLWPGMLLHVGIAVLGLGVACLAAGEDARPLRGLVVLNAVAWVVVLPLGLSSSWTGWSAFSPAVVSYFQPWMFGALAAHAAVCLVLWPRVPSGFAARAAVATGVGIVLLGSSTLVFPELLDGLDEARRWLTKDEVFQGMVKESKPLFVTELGLDATKAELRLSRFVYLLPLALFFLARSARGEGDARRSSVLFLVFWVTALAVVTLLQKRFFNSLAPGYAIVLAWAAVACWRARPTWLRDRAALSVAAAAAVLALGLAPMLATYEGPVGNLVARASGRPMTVPKNELSRRVLIATAEWIRDNTPPAGSFLDPGAAPEYGVLAAWTYGHLLKYVAERPTIVGNFGDDVGEANLRRVTAYFASREEHAVPILDDLRARYVLVRTLGAVPPDWLAGAAMRKRLSVDDSPGLEQHRLLYESRLAGEYVDIGRSEYRVFERVAGARIVGRAPPGATVGARFEYVSNRGRRGVWRSEVVAGEDGHYTIRVPYASRGGPPGVRPEGPYRVGTAAASERVVVDETSVQTGRPIQGPDFTR